MCAWLYNISAIAKPAFSFQVQDVLIKIWKLKFNIYIHVAIHVENETRGAFGYFVINWKKFDCKWVTVQCHSLKSWFTHKVKEIFFIAFNFNIGKVFGNLQV